MAFLKNDKKVTNAWAFYDWANSVYNLVITTVIFPMFYLAVTSGKMPQDRVNFFGFTPINSELYAYVLSASFLIVVLLVPILSGIADYTGKKKKFMQFFCYLGASSCVGLYFFDPLHLEFSMLFFFMASIGFWGSLVYYNSFLPEIATPDQHDKLSAKGFSLGYIGSVLLLIGLLIMIKADPKTVKYAFVAVGVWWAGFAQITYYHLPKSEHQKPIKISFSIIKNGYKELSKVWNELKHIKKIKRFLLAYFSYNMGVQTVMVMAVIFANKEINWPIDPVTGQADSTGLIVSIIIIQLIAIIGAVAMSRLSKKIGNVMVLIIAVFLWIGICCTAYFLHEPNEFYMLAAAVGFVMGGIQSMSRSTYSKLLPETEDHASYFSFYDVLEKVGLVIGPAVFAFTNGFTGSMRNSVLIITVFFIVGFFLLLWLNKVYKVDEVDV
jgi:UMF1 family MFS transporter